MAKYNIGAMVSDLERYSDQLQMLIEYIHNTEDVDEDTAIAIEKVVKDLDNVRFGQEELEEAY